MPISAAEENAGQEEMTPELPGQFRMTGKKIPS